MPQLKIKCSKCGVEKGTTKDRYKKLVKEAGGKRKLLARYVCRDCKRPKKTRKPKQSLNKIECSICHTKKGSNPARTKKLILQYGSYEEMQARYVCTTCRKEKNLDKQGRPKPEKRKRRKKVGTVEPDGTYKLPDSMKYHDPDFGDSQCIKVPEGVSTKKLNKALKYAINQGVKSGGLVRVKKR